MNFRIVFLIPVLVITLASCSDDTPTDAPPVVEKDVEIQPLHTANWWVYDYINDTYGDTTYYPSFVTDQVPVEKIIDGETWFSFYPPDSLGNNYIYYRNTDSGLVSLAGSDLRLVWKYPGVAGESYPDGWWAPGATCTIVSIDTLISVPAGEFHCYYYQIGSPGEVYDHNFYCPGVGKVKRLRIDGFAGSGSETQELRSYHVEE